MCFGLPPVLETISFNISLSVKRVRPKYSSRIRSIDFRLFESGYRADSRMCKICKKKKKTRIRSIFIRTLLSRYTDLDSSRFPNFFFPGGPLANFFCFSYTSSFLPPDIEFVFEFIFVLSTAYRAYTRSYSVE